MDIFISEHLNLLLQDFINLLDNYLGPSKLFIDNLCQLHVNYKTKTTSFIINIKSELLLPNIIECKLIMPSNGVLIVNSSNDEIEKLLISNILIMNFFKYFTCDIRKYRKKILEIRCKSSITNKLMSLSIIN